jgi:hypothetical protein
MVTYGRPPIDRFEMSELPTLVYIAFGASLVTLHERFKGPPRK